MRLAPIPIFYHARNEDPVALAGESSRTTHGAAVAVDACRFLCALIGGAFRGASKEELLSSRFASAIGYWENSRCIP